MVLDEISDGVAEKANQAMERLLRQTGTTEEWNQALFALLLTSAGLLQKTYGDEAWRVVLERLLSKLDGTSVDLTRFH